ncbi:hypothetical protein KA531_03510 [Candidatus Saccharibacteria bacterium]|nr:hypothetical protein [Candidatus Saccharibacteria bacterium]
MKSPESKATERKKFLSGPALWTYGFHVGSLVEQIDNLSFPKQAITDPLLLAAHTKVVRSISYRTQHRAVREARRLGIADDKGANQLEMFGFADREFTGAFAGALGIEISYFLRYKRFNQSPLSLMDYGMMFQTGWFGDIVNQMALTGPTLLGPIVNQMKIDRVVGKNRSLFGSLADKSIQDYKKIEDIQDYFLELKNDTDDSIEGVDAIRQYIKLTNAGRKFFISKIDHTKSVGCPVARSSTIVSQQYYFLLEELGALDRCSSGKVLTQGNYRLTEPSPYTPIDRVLWHWGDYVLRYAGYLLSLTNDQETRSKLLPSGQIGSDGFLHPSIAS